MSETFAMPVMSGPASRKVGAVNPQFVWVVTPAHRRQAQSNHGQSLERLRERGGLCWSEMYGVLHGVSWGNLPSGPQAEAWSESQCRAYLLAHPKQGQNRIT